MKEVDNFRQWQDFFDVSGFVLVRFACRKRPPAIMKLILENMDVIVP